MAEINIFEDDAFGVAGLTAAINESPVVPGRLAALGLFEEEGSTTVTQQIEKDGDTLALVPAKDRGAAGLVVTGSKRLLIPFNAVHLPQTFSIMADEIQGIRAFGELTELQAVQDVVAKRLAKARRQLDATHEFQRMGAILGTILDADGVTVLLDLYQRFDIDEQVLDMDLDVVDTEVRLKAGEALDMQEDALGNVPSTGARAFCGKDFWNKLIVHKSVKETFLNSQQAAQLRGDARESFDFGGITWERYRGKVGSLPFIPSGEARLVPEGVPELFLSVFAPANYMETVNTLGLPYYAKQERLPFDKGIAGEAQSNPLHICSRPRTIIKLVM
ncbi:major capsid protein [Pseudomonas aeruginosa]|uniref:major capsid protein n=1 Tax=Pseudomonas aeruginosa group TaxID=136841 RepID=UPI0007102500|nr:MULTISPECIES: major capsid protein [Pseudomonas aeruginosa group]MDG9855651.1 major capsid protein [Pseudomonas nitroreducens]